MPKEHALGQQCEIPGRILQGHFRSCENKDYICSRSKKRALRMRTHGDYGHAANRRFSPSQGPEICKTDLRPEVGEMGLLFTDRQAGFRSS